MRLGGFNEIVRVPLIRQAKPFCPRLHSTSTMLWPCGCSLFGGANVAGAFGLGVLGTAYIVKYAGQI